MMAAMLPLAGCGYHAVGNGPGAAAHIPAGVHTIAVPFFENKTQVAYLETRMTQQVVRELALRTRLEINPKNDPEADATLKGTILTQSVVPLTYTSSATTTTTSSYVITVTAKVVLTDHQGHVLFENDNYTFRQMYESTEQLSSFIEEDSPAMQRLAKDFAQSLVGDMLESF
jgi:outer membrane lipopolysaccharide assembly protein LptE/RlpB